MKNANDTGTAKTGFRKFMALAVAFMGSAVLVCLGDGTPQDGDVLLYLPLDGDMDTIACVSEDAGSTVTGTPTYDSDVWKMYLSESGIPTNTVRSGMNQSSLYANKTKITRTINHPHIKEEDFNSATIEFFMKGSSNDADVATWENKLSLGNGSRCGLMVQASNDKKYYVKIQTDSIETYTVSPFLITDGKWHHFAVIIESANGGADTQITWNYDYGSKVVTTTKSGAWAGFRYNQTLTFGATGSVLWLDEFRITKGALTQDKFIRFVSNPNPQDGDTLFYMPLDSDMESIAPFYAADIDAGSTLTGGPAYDGDVWKANVVEYGDPDIRVRKEKNLGCLKAEKKQIVKKMVNPFMTALDVLEPVTIEFFMKGSSVPGEVADWENKMSLGNDNTKCGLMIQADSSTNYYLRVDTDSGKADIYSSLSMRDGEWHHFAIAIEPVSGGTQTKVTFHFDYGDPVVKTANGSWCGFRNDQNFTFGATKSVLWMDEFRVSKGILPKSKFMKARTISGFTLVVR